MAKKPKGKPSPKAKPQKRHKASKYNKFQHILSEYAKESGADFRGKNFNTVAAAIWKKSKGMPLSAIRGSIDILFENNSGINPPVDMSGIPQNVNYWALKDVVSSIGANVNIYVDNSIFPGIEGYEGKAGDFIDSGASTLMLRELNRFMKDNFPRQSEERYSVYISEVEPDGSVRITLSSSTEMAEIAEPGEEPITEPKIIPSKEKEKPEKPTKPKKAKRTAKEEKEISAAKLRVVKERIKLEKQKERSSKQKEKTEKQIEKTLKSKIKLADKALQLKKAGFTKKEIMAILGK